MRIHPQKITYLDREMGNFVLLTAVVVMMVFARTADSMTNSWAVEIQSGGRAAADQLASKHGFINLGQVSSLMGAGLGLPLFLHCRSEI